MHPSHLRCDVGGRSETEFDWAKYAILAASRLKLSAERVPFEEEAKSLSEGSLLLSGSIV